MDWDLEGEKGMRYMMVAQRIEFEPAGVRAAATEPPKEDDDGRFSLRIDAPSAQCFGRTVSLSARADDDDSLLCEVATSTVVNHRRGVVVFVVGVGVAPLLHGSRLPA